jgi:cytochrome c oxidase subunit 2
MAGCRGEQAALDPAGIQSERISDLWWHYFNVCVGIYVVTVSVILLGTLLRRKPNSQSMLELAPSDRKERWLMSTVAFSTGLSALLLFVLLFGDYVTGRELTSLDTSNALKVQVTAHQWWWEFRYDDPEPSQIVTTANELHLPVGKPVIFEMQSPDVIHSLWIPNLHGKRDIIPGYKTRLLVRFDRTGTYGGQCAEFCGLQHANMRFTVVAESEAEFETWLADQRLPAIPPSTESQKRGQHVFLSASCVMCHTIQGTPASGMMGPDLTHVASRPRIGTILPNTRGHLAGWIADPQRIKPGVRMPLNTLEPEDLQVLVDYLESLK